MGLILTRNDKKFVVFILFVVAIIVGYFLIRTSPVESECINAVLFRPGTSKVETHYAFGFRQFETKQEAIDYCVTIKN